jgi:saccharopine dehydrogenase (NAD+, L-glutamate forming)
MSPTHRLRDYDVVLLGATGFTGGLTADYLARHAPDGCRWAIAGRSLDRLGAVRDRLSSYDARLVDLPLLVADVADPESTRALAAQTRVLASTVGPFIRHGASVVAACAEAGTDYADLAGEPEFVDRMYVDHHARAVETGARLVHSCGFDSIPYDLGVQYTVEQLPEGVPISVDGFVAVGGRPSAGTYHTAVTAFARRRESKAAAAARRAMEARPVDRHAASVPGRPHRSAEVDAWAVPLPTIDPQVVARSARALDRYGPHFTYRHFASARSLSTLLTRTAALSAAFALAQLAPTRDWLMGRMTPGDGPSEDRRARSWFQVTFVGSGGGVDVVTRVSGGDPGYDETAKMLSEAALCLAYDDVPPTAGQVTPAVAMGAALRRRLVDAGLTFEVLIPAD